MNVRKKYGHLSYRELPPWSQTVDRVYGHITGHYIDGKSVSEADLEAYLELSREKEAEDRAERDKLPDCKPSWYVIDRDGRWSTENHGRGHAMTVEGEERFFDSKADLDRYCASKGLATTTDWSNVYDTASHKQSQPIEHPDPEPLLRKQWENA